MYPLWILEASGTQPVLRMNGIHTPILVFKYSPNGRRILVDQRKDGQINNSMTMEKAWTGLHPIAAAAAGGGGGGDDYDDNYDTRARINHKLL